MVVLSKKPTVLFNFKKQTVSSFCGSGPMLYDWKEVIETMKSHRLKKEEWQKGFSFRFFNK